MKKHNNRQEQNKKSQTTHGSEKNKVVHGRWNKGRLEFTIVR